MEKIIMPKAGMAMETGTVIEWLKDVGDYVEFGEPLLEIETDKTSMTVESLASGYLLQKLYDAGDEVPVVTTIGWLGEKGEVPPEPGSPDVKSAQVPACAPAASEGTAGYDFVVLGGGPAGYTGAILAARAGRKTAIVEEDALGGTCLNRGCIPTKTYLHTADLLAALPELAERGVRLADPAVEVDMAAAVNHKNGVVRKLVKGLEGLMRSNGIDVYHQKGTLHPDHTVSLADGTVLKADKVLLATGSVPATIPIEGIDLPGVLDSTQLLDLEDVPERLVIIGGGVIGVELACAFDALGSKVTILEALPSVIANMDPEIREVVAGGLKKAGIGIHTGTGVQKITASGGVLQVHTADGQSVPADKVLVAVGRKPNLSALGSSGVQTDDRGCVRVNDVMQTNLDWVYAPGDANGRCMLAHAAFYMAEIAVNHALGKTKTYNPNMIPSCIYSKPEAASIGPSEEKLKKDGRRISVGRFPFSANGRALASGEGAGLVKSIVDADTGEILAVHMVGPDAAEMINDAAILMAMEITAYELNDVVWAHPDFGEALKQSLLDAVGESPDLPPRKR